MSKSTQRKQSAFDFGRLVRKTGRKRRTFVNPFGPGLGLVFLAGFNSEAKKVIKKTFTRPSWKTQTEKNKAKRQRKRLRKLYA